MNALSETIETSNPISSAAVLVELNISVWGASRLDRSATDQVVNGANAVSNAAQVRKNLMAGDHTRKEIADFAAGCRMWHNRQTMPWSDKGSRLLPTSAFLDYKRDADNRKAEFDSLVQTFLTAYPQLVIDAQTRMGSLFDPGDYPDVAEVASKFGFSMTFSPVPDVGDFRVKVTDDAMAEMQSSYNDAFASRMAAVVKEPWDRLHEMLVAMSAKMTEDDGPRYRVRKNKAGETIRQEIKRPFHESFVTNAQSLCDMLKHLNITKDPALERARLALENTIFNVDIDKVRESPETRADIKASVDKILTENETFW
jgi:hypothetical protein